MPRFQKILNIIKNNIYILLLSIIVVIVLFLNYTPNTFLSGWDTLHPEFNFQLNLERVFYGVFRTEQGLGAVAAHAHMSEIPRILMLYLASVFIEISFIRYFYMFLMLLIGPIGMYIFIKRILLREIYLDKNLINLISFTGGLFYLLNLGTVQQFIVPFEMFVTAYGYLPWLFYLSTKYIILKTPNKSRRYLLYFAIASILASPMAYASIQWYIFASLIIIFWIGAIIRIRDRLDLISSSKKLAKLISVLILTNFYWILPNLYFLINNSADVRNAKINKLFSEQAFLYNKEFGNIVDILLLRSFLFDWSVYNGLNFQRLLDIWINHLSSPYILAIGSIIALFSLLGLVGLFAKRNIISIGVGLCLVPILFLLFNDNFPTSTLYKFLQDNSNLFKEVLRFPHNKVYGVYMFIYAVCFSYGIFISINLIKRIKNNKILYSVPVVLIILVTAYCLPVFKGELISPYMRVKIPDEYFIFYEYMQDKPEERLAILPIHSFWGWEYHKWNDSSSVFQGAGFLWFGLKQPLLHRDFDRWSPYNEQAYRELSHAVYSSNASNLNRVAVKYNIKYLLLDESIFEPETDQGVLYFAQLKNLLNDQKYFTNLKNIGFLKIYDVKSVGENNLIKGINKPFEAENQLNNTPIDKYYLSYGNYIHKNDPNYSYQNLYDNQFLFFKNKFRETISGIQIIPNKSVSHDVDTYLKTEKYVSADLIFKKDNNQLSLDIYPYINEDINLKNSPIYLTGDIDSDSVYLSINSDTYLFEDTLEETSYALSNIQLKVKDNNSMNLYTDNQSSNSNILIRSGNHTIGPCGIIKSNQEYGLKFDNNLNSFRLFTKNLNLCMLIPLDDQIEFKDQAGSLLKVSIELNESGTLNRGNDHLTFCIADARNGNCITGEQKLTSNEFYYTNLKTIYYPIIDSKSLALKILLDGTHTQDLTQASISNINIGLTRPEKNYIILPENIKSSLLSSEIPSNNDFTVLYSGESKLSPNITKLPRGDGTCTQSPLTRLDEMNKNLEYLDEAIRYTSESGSQCDHFSFPQLKHDSSYLLLIESRNLSGLPLSMCLTNLLSKRCDLYTQLNSSDKFTKQLFYVPQIPDGANGYDVNINNLGIKKSPAINEIKSIHFIPYPDDYLSSLSLSRINLDKTTESSFSNIADTTNYNSSKIGFVNTEDEYIYFNRAYNKDWELYYLKNNNFFEKAFPFFLGKKQDRHVVANSWQNAWANDPNYAYGLILFLPQYYMYIGLSISIGLLIFLIILNRK